MITLLIIWSIAGLIFYGHDTVANELRWSREEPLFTWHLLAAGPLVWMFLILVALATVMVFLFHVLFL